MKKLIFCFFCLFTLIPLAAAEKNLWQEKRSTHFIIYYKNAPGSFIDQASSAAEDYYDKIADNLGFRRLSFWLWDKRAKIYIYDDAKDYQVSTGKPEWSGGFAIIDEKAIYTFPFAKNWDFPLTLKPRFSR